MFIELKSRQVKQSTSHNVLFFNQYPGIRRDLYYFREHKPNQAT